MINQPADLNQLGEDYSYYEVYKQRFTGVECEKIIDLHREHLMLLSKMSSSEGLTLRDCNLFWIPRIEPTDWIFSRLWEIVTIYNSKYRFELSGDMGQAQLTRYVAGQHYDWHMDLGSRQSSLRKISVIVELTPQPSIDGGCFEVFYGEAFNNKVNLNIGDVVVFPSFVMHRALTVDSWTRWSFVLWQNGARPLK